MENNTNERSYEPHVMQRIEPLLERYFAGDVETNGSNFGSMIERMKLYGMAAFPCLKPGCLHGIMPDGTDCKGCKGTGRRLDQFDSSGELVAYGAVTIDGAPERDFVRAKCTCCEGTGLQWPKNPEKRKVMKLEGTEIPLCGDCGGLGMVVPVDAQPGSPTRGEGGYRMRESEMEFQAVVNRVMRQVMVTSPVAFYVLSAYYGSIGDHWATFDGLGRIFSLWPLTKPGQQLLELTPSRADRTPHDRLHTQWRAQIEKPTEHRATLIRQCGHAARDLHHESKKCLAVADRDHDGRLFGLAMRKRPERFAEVALA